MFWSRAPLFTLQAEVQPALDKARSLASWRIMPRLQDTAYPRLKSVMTDRDLAAVYTPTEPELLLARRTAKGPAAQLGFLILLKLFQRLGRPVPLADAPRSVVEHIARGVGVPAA